MKITDTGNSCGEVYHYTSMAAALNIITEKGLTFHASRYDNMEDEIDSGYGFAVSHAIMEEGGVDFINMDNYNCRPYVLSFCKKKDDFSMRRLYNAEVALHIDSDLLLKDAISKSDKVMGKDVLYLSESETTKFVLDAFKHYFYDKGDFEELDFEAKAKCSFLKHPDYSVENEWRLAYFEDFDLTNGERSESLMADSLSSEVRFKTVNGIPRIYRGLTFDKRCLKGITIFKHSFPEQLNNRDTLETWLAKCGYEHDSINISITKTPQIKNKH